MSNLTGLAVGTQVMVFDSNFGSNRVRKAAVESVTRGGNYRLSGSKALWNDRGNVRGSDAYSHEWFELFDQEKWDKLAAENRERNDRYRLHQATDDFSKLSIDVVRALLAVIDASK